MNTNFVLFAERMIARPVRQTFSHSTKNREHDHPLIHFNYDNITNPTHLQANFVHPVSEFEHFENKRNTGKGKLKTSLTLSLSLLSVSH